MKLRELAVVAGAFLFALLLAMAINRGRTLGVEGAAQAKAELMEVRDFRMLHNGVYARVGEEQWAGEIKPAFMRELTLRTIRSTGDPFPDWPDIVDWAKDHPRETRDLLQKHVRPLD